MPESDSQHEAYEEIADYFATTNCCWGYPYTVYRVDELSSSSSSQVAPYTNSLILNDRVFVPLGTNDTYNENALAVYREAMPGYTIIGVEEDSNHPWENTDALHCRTRGVMDFDMLFVDHRNVIQGEQPMQSSFQVTSTFIPYSGEALASAQIYYRIDGGEWQTATMTATREEDEYTGYITGYSYGSTVEYYVSATDAAGNTSTQPVMGAQDPHSFKIEESSSSLYWTADDSGYDNYMPITAIVQIDGVEQATNTLEVGVFCGDECRASAIGELFSFNNKYILSLLVYGQDDEEFSFRLYDHSTGAELTPDLVAPANVTFSQDGYGSPLDPYVLNFTTVTPEYDITVSANPTAGGTVSGAGTYTQGDQATVTASANEGYDFVNWTINGTEVSTSASYTFTVAEAAELVANFSLKTYTITVNANPAEGGTVTGAGTYNHGDEVTLTATANENYRFIGWMEEGEVISSETTYTFTASADKTYTAKFSSSLYWTADPGEIEDNMNMSAIIQIDGEEQFTNTLEVGVFVGEECRASAIGVLAPFNNRYILTLLIYGTEDESFSFRLYDHATEAELTLTLAAPADVTFNTDGYGSPINPYVLNFTSETATVRQDFSLNAGWNWWSTYLEMEDGEGLSLLEDALGSNGIQIKSKNGFNSYTDFGWYGSLDALFNENMYLVKVAEAGDYSITGTVADPAEHTITLNSGWNWIGYVESTAIDINTALANLSASNNDMIKSHNSFTTYIEGYGWAGTLTSLTPSQGYLVSAANAASFVYPSAKGHEYDASDDLVAETYWKPAGNKFPHNMSVLAVVELDGVELRTEDAELAAFAADGECRGAVKLMYVEPLDRYLAFLTVYGEDGEQLHFRVRHGETNHGVEQTLTMMIDEVHGTATMPYMITAKGNTGLAENAILGLYPNPSAKGQQVRIDLAETSGAFTIEVIDILGRCIYTTDSNTLSAPEVPGAYTLRVTDEQGNTQFGKLIVK